MVWLSSSFLGAQHGGKVRLGRGNLRDSPHSSLTRTQQTRDNIKCSTIEMCRSWEPESMLL